MVDFFSTVGGQRFVQILEMNSNKQTKALEDIALALQGLGATVPVSEEVVQGRMCPCCAKPTIQIGNYTYCSPCQARFDS